MKTLLTVLFTLILTTSFSQAIKIGGTTVERVLFIYDPHNAQGQKSTTRDIYTAGVSDWMYQTLKKEIELLKAEVARLKQDSTEIFVKGMQGKGTKDSPLTSQFKGFYTTTQRDAAFKKGELKLWDQIVNTTTGTLQMRTKTMWKAL